MAVYANHATQPAILVMVRLKKPACHVPHHYCYKGLNALANVMLGITVMGVCVPRVCILAPGVVLGPIVQSAKMGYR